MIPRAQVGRHYLERGELAVEQDGVDLVEPQIRVESKHPQQECDGGNRYQRHRCRTGLQIAAFPPAFLRRRFPSGRAPGYPQTEPSDHDQEEPLQYHHSLK